ncbi:MAG: ATP-dependent DNA ligase [Acidimicrobiales bacterium]
MSLPVRPPLSPMLSKLVRELPHAQGLHYEPKWDGFRCIVFRDAEQVELGSRNERSLTRYFPELVEPLLLEIPTRAVVDGEVVIAGPDGLDFDALTQRIHPAASRVRLLAAQTPAAFVAFDLLALDSRDLRPEPYVRRRAELEALLANARPPVHLTPVTTDRAVALDWFDRFEGAGLDGVMAKAADLSYREGERVMLKVKHERSADCAVAGFRWHKDSGVGSLLLGLFDAHGALHHVGVASGFSAARRHALVDELAPLREDALEDHPWRRWAEQGEHAGTRMPGAQSRWSAGKDLAWEALRVEQVCEVAYDHLQRDRFRHATTFRRWRPDREPSSCTYDQLETPVPAELSTIFSASS